MNKSNTTATFAINVIHYLEYLFLSLALIFNQFFPFAGKSHINVGTSHGGFQSSKNDSDESISFTILLTQRPGNAGFNSESV